MSTLPPRPWHDRATPPSVGPVSRAGPLSRPPRFFKVVLHRAVEKDLLSVVRAVIELTRFGTAEAEYRMWETHHRGRSLVVVTHFERAELYVEQFADRGFLASIEPA